MYKIKTFNKIDPAGLNKLNDNFAITEDNDYDGIILRSYKMTEAELTDKLVAVARAGAGYNNIPVDLYAENGVVVFNTPGANANAVKEITILAALMASRKVAPAIEWVQGLKDTGVEVTKEVEAQKAAYTGPELLGKKVGILGLGAIGVIVANAFADLGMEVYGYDPFISVENAWHLQADINRVAKPEWLFENCDYVTIHIPLSDATKGFVGKDLIGVAKKGIRILNMARGELCDNKAIIDGINDGTIAAYVTDFPDNELLGIDGIIPIPHLGASTPESETNCAIMAANQIAEYIQYGNIKNSVNYPDCDMGRKATVDRITLNHLNIPNMVGQITTVLANDNINIANMINKSRGEYAYTIIDVDNKITDEVVADLKAIGGIMKVRVI
ncbi:MAG: phosphoglycerate dehydrogenase [Eubacteriaceae bacterium]|nr:phosphoglycerate dehydrogenase [Eubacteriaceae bacterium]